MKKLKEMITDRMTLTEFAEKMHISITLASLWANGKRNVMPYHIHNIAKVLDVPVSEVAKACNVDNSLIPYYELPERLGVCRTTLDRWRNTGYMQTIKKGQYYYITRAEMYRLKQSLELPIHDVYLNLTESAEYLGTSYSNVQRWAKKGKIPSRKRANLNFVYVRLTDLKKLKKSIDKGV